MGGGGRSCAGRDTGDRHGPLARQSSGIGGHRHPDQRQAAHVAQDIACGAQDQRPGSQSIHAEAHRGAGSREANLGSFASEGERGANEEGVV